MDVKDFIKELSVKGALAGWKTSGQYMMDAYYAQHANSVTSDKATFFENVEVEILRTLIKVEVIGKSNAVVYDNQPYQTTAQLTKLAAAIYQTYGLDTITTLKVLSSLVNNTQVNATTSPNKDFVVRTLEKFKVSFDVNGIMVGDLYGHGTEPIQLDSLMPAIYVEADYAINVNQSDLQKDYIKEIVMNTLNEIKANRDNEVRQLLKYTGDNIELVDLMVKKMLTTNKIPCTHANIEMMKHLLWSLKRKIYGKSIPMPVFFTFFGKAMGVGKSYFIQNILCYPFKDRCNIDARLGDLLNPASRKATVDGYWCLDFQELTIPEEACRADGSVKDSMLNQLKTTITSEYFASRQYYTERSSKVPQTAVFCSSSNKHIYDVVKDGEGMRRYWEFAWGIQDKREIDAKFIEISAKLQSKMVELYQNINEDYEFGYYHQSNAHFDSMCEAQEVYRHISPIEQFVLDSGIKLSDKIYSASTFISKNDLFNQYFEPWAESEGRSWTIHGMVKAINDRYDIKPTRAQKEGSRDYGYHVVIEGEPVKLPVMQYRNPSLDDGNIYSALEGK